MALSGINCQTPDRKEEKVGKLALILCGGIQALVSDNGRNLVVHYERQVLKTLQGLI